ncbi:MAG: LemA family protein [Cyanobacterium sp.]
MIKYKNLVIPDDIFEEVLSVATKLYYQNSKKQISTWEQKTIIEQEMIPSEIIVKALNQVRKEQLLTRINSKRSKKKKENFKLVSIATTIIVSFWSIFTYNGLNSRQQDVMEAWAQVENQLQRRANLIPTLVSLTEAQTQEQKELILRLENAHQGYLEADGVEEKMAATNRINGAIQDFNEYALGNQGMVSNQVFTNLQYEIVGTENRIATERRRYNQLVRQYNQGLQSFPNSLLVRLFNFEEKAFYE